MPTLLVVEDEPDMLSLLDSNLRGAGFEVLLARSGEEALAHLLARVPDLVLLDLMLPDVPGTEIHRRVKADPRTRGVPVVMVTARKDEADRIAGLELGADDYVTKPFSVRELVLRIRAVLRRAASRARVDGAAPDAVGPIRVDVDGHRCFVDGAEIELTRMEFDLLGALMARPGRVLSRQRLLEDVWGAAAADVADVRTVDTHVKRLREKLGGARGLLETVRGVGYRLAADGER